MGFLDWLFKKSQKEILYINPRKLTKTGKFRVRGSDFNQERSYFGVDKRILKFQDISESAKKVYIYLSRIKMDIAFHFIKLLLRDVIYQRQLWVKL